MKICKSSIIFLVLVLASFRMISHNEVICQTLSQEVQVNQETIEIEVGYFIVLEEYWGPNVKFNIEFSPGPLNLSKYKDIISTEYIMFMYGNKYLTFLNLTFEGDDFVEIAEIADNISREILKAFDHTSLQIIVKSGPINSNGFLKFIYKFGSLPFTVETVLDFLKYKPETGFGKLINEDFLRLYIPGNETTGVYLAYIWERTETACWQIIVESSLNILHSPGEKTVNLNELIGNDEPITATHGLIRVYIWNWTLDSRKYVIRTLNVSPPGYTVTKSWDQETYEWTLNGSIENVIINLETFKIEENTNPIVFVITAAIIASIILVVGVATATKKIHDYERIRRKHVSATTVNTTSF